MTTKKQSSSIADSPVKSASEKQLIAQLNLEKANLTLENIHLKGAILEYQARDLANTIPGLQMEVSNLSEASSGGEVV